MTCKQKGTPAPRLSTPLLRLGHRHPEFLVSRLNRSGVTARAAGAKGSSAPSVQLSGVGGGGGKTRGRRPGHGALGPASQEQQGAWGPTAGWEEAPPTDPSGATPLVGEPADPATCLRGQGHRREAERRERGVRCPQGHTLTRRVGCPWGHTCGGVSTGPPPPHLLSHDLSGLLRGV